MKNVMYVVHSLGVGGLEKCVVDLVNGLDKNAFNPMICCLTTTGPLADKIHGKNIEIFEMNKKSGNDFLLPQRLARLFRRKKVDIIHSGNWGTMFESFLGAKMACVPTIIHMEQGMELIDIERLSKLRKFLRGLIKYFCSLGIKKIVTVSNDLKEYVHRTTHIPKDKIEVIYNSVNTERYYSTASNRERMRRQLGLGKHDIMIGSVGRLAEVKNYSCLVAAMKLVNDVCPQTKLFIVGDGPLKNTLQTQIQEYGFAECVTLLGERSDITDLLAAMDVYVLPSIFEGISISILEAMAAGLPVVATRVGGNSEIIVDGKTGYLVESRNSKMLASKLVELIKDNNLSCRFSKEAIKRVNEVFHNKAMVSAYSTLYRAK